MPDAPNEPAYLSPVPHDRECPGCPECSAHYAREERAALARRRADMARAGSAFGFGRVVLS